MSANAFLNPGNIDHMLEQPKRSFAWIGMDTIDDCNLHCLYCHNLRTKQRIDFDKVQQFLDCNVESVNVFQIGCAMEPCLDKRLVEALSLVSNSVAMPTRQFKVHTNGTLLNRHDHVQMRELGLTHLSVSIDSADEETFAMLTGGAKLEIVFRNVRSFCKTCPDVTVQFVATVNTANIAEMPKLVEKGLEVGARRFHFREMYHHPGGKVVDDHKMKKLVLSPGQFLEMQEEIEELFEGQAGFFFGSSNNLVAASKVAKKESYPVH